MSQLRIEVPSELSDSLVEGLTQEWIESPPSNSFRYGTGIGSTKM
jgi:hypothetical protein